MTTDPVEHPVEHILREWIVDPEITIFCGHWARGGGVMELLPRGAATLSGPRYEPPFDGLRELRIAGTEHHVHLDLARITHAWYVIVPSVCFGFRPSFELRLTDEDATPLDSYALGLGLARPYDGRRLRTETVERFLSRAADHAERFPDAVSMWRDRSGGARSSTSDWLAIEALLARVDRPEAGDSAPWRGLSSAWASGPQSA